MARLTGPNGLQQMAYADTSWVRRAAGEWANAEPTRGAPNCTALSGLEQELLNAATHGLRVVLVVGGAPDWPLVDPPKICGRVRLDKMGALASFVHELVARHRGPPYNVRHWEMWNEPDVDRDLVGTISYYGCWGDDSDQHYGGGHYAEMLKQVYPQGKAADPQSPVLVGGLLLDCDPRTPGLFPGGNDKPPKFVEGILQWRAVFRRG